VVVQAARAAAPISAIQGAVFFIMVVFLSSVALGGLDPARQEALDVVRSLAGRNAPSMVKFLHRT
jgi:hypothetical protein